MRRLLWLCAGVALAWTTLSGVTTSAAGVPLTNQRLILDAASTTEQASLSHHTVINGHFLIFCRSSCKTGDGCC